MFILRRAGKDDLDAINKVIASAILTWNLSERVKRLSTASYFYNELDLEHMEIILAENSRHQIVGVTAWEDADPKDVPKGKSALLLHGIFVAPEHHHQGIGGQLFASAEQAAKRLHHDGLLVKAQTDAIGFFITQGMQKLPVTDPDRNYENRFWKSVPN